MNSSRIFIAIRKMQHWSADPMDDRLCQKEDTRETMKKSIDTPGLSPRERSVLHHVASGKVNRDISAILGISERTVEKHLERVYKKLGVETRTAAVIYFLNNNDKQSRTGLKISTGH